MWRNTASRFGAGAALAYLACAGLRTSAEAADYKVLYAFAGGAGNDGQSPSASLIEVGGVLYGTTTFGRGSLAGCHPNDPNYLDGCGTVFSVTTAGKETVLYAFLESPDGGYPDMNMLALGGRLVGTTGYGGHPGGNRGMGLEKGTIFTLAQDGTQTVRYRFRGAPDGLHPSSGLLNVGGTLYGTTLYGGTAGYGTVFALTRDGTETVLHSFASGTDGSAPGGNLINVNGVLYGTTQYGGNGACTNGCGTVFSITPAGVETVLFQFQGDNGANPFGGLLQIGNELYGTTFGGGSKGFGTVYSMTLDGQLTGLHPFRGDNGAFPAGSLINVGGTLYGTTSGGGTGTACYSLCGTVFSMTLHGAIEVVHDFQGGYTDGSQPEAGLINVGGMLYGTTTFGGGSGCRSSGCGTVFAIEP